MHRNKCLKRSLGNTLEKGGYNKIHWDTLKNSKCMEKRLIAMYSETENATNLSVLQN